MFRRIFNWFAEGQAPPPDVLDEERGVDWDAWSEASKEDAPRPMFVDMKMEKEDGMPSCEEMFPLSERSIEIDYDPAMRFLSSNIFYDD